jgi:hypothetical protein
MNAARADVRTRRAGRATFIDFYLVAPGTMMVQVHLQITHPQHGFHSNPRATPGQRINTSKHFCESERLHEVVVGARAQTVDAISDLAEQTDDQMRESRFSLA